MEDDNNDKMTVCELCWKDVPITVISELSNTLMLVKVHDQYSIISSNGHKDEELITFSTAPRKDPFYYANDDRIDTMSDEEVVANAQWFDEALVVLEDLNKLSFQQSIYVLYLIKELGYKDEYGIEYQYLFQVMGEKIEEYELQLASS